MQLTVFVEPGPAGFRATAGGPLPLTADGPSADAAVAALQAQLAARLAAGGELRTVTVADPPAAADAKPGSAAAILAAVARLSPPSDEWVAAVEEYRRANNTVPDDD